MTAPNQSWAWDVIYDPFGNVSYSWSNPEVMNIRFPGQWFQLETGLAYNWHRHYDATLGRYVQPDPLGLRALMSDGPSAYGYVGGNPMAYVDPRGLEVFSNYTMGPLQLGDIWDSQLPNYPNAQVYTSIGRRFIAPKGTDWCAIKAAGQANGLNPFAVWKNVGHYGTYDFQRIGGRHSEYIDASNYSVGVYMNGAGYWQWRY